MAKEWQFYDSSRARRRVKEAYFYDSGGALRKIKEGHFYDAQGVRRTFFEGGLAPPATGYYPGSNFTMMTGEDATYTGFTAAAFGEVAPDAGTTGDRALYPTTNAAAHAARMTRARRTKTNSAFELFWDLNPFVNPAADTKFWGVTILGSSGGYYASLLRSNSTETPAATSIRHVWSYISPLTVGTIYQFLFKERAVNTTMIAGTSGVLRGFSSGAGGISSVAFGSMENQMLTTRVGWNIVALVTSGAEEYLTLEIQGPSGATDPGKGFIAGLISGVAGIGTKGVESASYSWNAALRIATWDWEETTEFTNAVQSTVQLG